METDSKRQDDERLDNPIVMPVEQKKKNKFLGIASFVGILLAVFIAGIAVGDGRVHLRSQVSTANGQLPKSLDYSSVDDVYKLVKKDYDGTLNQSQVLDGLKEGIAKSTGDPYTEYFNPDDSKDFSQQLNGSFEGIGAELGKDKDSIVIVSPLSGYPAEKAGLKPKDVILKINGQTVNDITISEAVKRIRGPKDSVVKLTVYREGQQPFDVSITRAKISIPSVEYSVVGDIGYLKISQFGDDTVSLTRKAADEFKQKNVKGIVLDLRGNPGGYLEAAVDVSSLWLKNGQKVVEEKRGGVTIKTQAARGDATLLGIPTVVLINDGSASASEITAGALHDNGAATLVGIKSFGKGSVQQIEQLPNGSSIKITIARWYTPKGRNIDKQGIEPDITVAAPTSEADIAAKLDPQKDKAIELLKQKIQ